MAEVRTDASSGGTGTRYHAVEISPTPMGTVSVNGGMLTGSLLRKPTRQSTGAGLDVANFKIKVEGFGRTERVPCVCLGRNAAKAASLAVGDRVDCYGGLRSWKRNGGYGRCCIFQAFDVERAA